MEQETVATLSEDHTIHIVKESEHWNKMLNAEQLCEAIVEYVLLALESDTKEITVLLGDNEKIHALNMQYRGKDSPTNVLSFPSDEGGDIILAYETLQQEATQQHKLFSHHLVHLLVHATLHLLGYDHKENNQAHIMEKHEIDILHSLDITNPYE